MAKLSCFKLPLLMSVVFIIARLLMIMGINVYQKGDAALEHLITANYFLSHLTYALPLFVWIFFISTIAMANFKVYIVNAKNIALVYVLALIVCCVLYFIMQYYYKFIFTWIYPHIFDEYRGSTMMILGGLQILSGVINYMVVTGLIFGAVFSFSYLFDKDSTNQIGEIGARAHLFLFILFILSVYLFLGQKTAYFYYEIAETKIIMLSQYISIVIFVLILYFVIRNNFNQSFKALQIGRVMIAGSLSLILSLLLNLVSVVVMVFIALFSYYSRGTGEMMILVVLLLMLVTMVLSFDIFRLVTKRYFFNPINHIDVNTYTNHQ